jgi:hypothetical protein
MVSQAIVARMGGGAWRLSAQNANRGSRMNFDKVELDHPDGTTRVLVPAEFRSLSPIDRVQWIGQGRFRFFLSGMKVTASQALKINR